MQRRTSHSHRRAPGVTRQLVVDLLEEAEYDGEKLSTNDIARHLDISPQAAHQHLQAIAAERDAHVSERTP